jgi:glucose-6-phosphate dehydrogenase assembly protein OpcA
VEAAVSALAPDARERSDWHGEDVEIDEVAAQLTRLNHEHARHEHGHAATRTLTLLVAPGPDVEPQLVAARLEQMHARHPARTIVLGEHAAERLDASLRIECAVGGGAGAVGACHDAIVLRADATRLRHADSLAHALLIGGLPVVLWLPGAQASLADGSLAALADAVVLDSGAGDEPPAGFARAADHAARTRVRDLAWLRLQRWRQRVAARFDDPAAAALLPRVERVELRCAQADLASALLLAGWIAARAGWRLTALAGARGDWHGRARRPDGAVVELALGCPDPAREPPGIHRLALHAGAPAIELLEPVAEPDEARAFAAALRTYDEPDRGYEPALTALREGLGTR